MQTNHQTGAKLHHHRGTCSVYSMISVYRLCTLQPSTCSPLPLLLSRQSLALPLAEGLSVVPAHLNHREAQALPNTWTRSCRLRNRGSVEQKARRACWEMCKKHWKTAHLSPKHSFHRQPPRSRLDGSNEEISHQLKLFTWRPHKYLLVSIQSIVT